MKNEVTAEIVRELFDYCAKTGFMTRKKSIRAFLQVGERAGYFHKSSGYFHMKIFGTGFPLHRIAWLHFYGVWPSFHIDHIDGDRINNAIQNLRDVPMEINSQNQRLAHKNRRIDLPLGVHASRGMRYMAQIRVGGKNKYLGTFDTPEIASAAYLSAKRSVHIGCTI